MANKSTKPAKPAALTQEERKEQVLRFIAQKRNEIYTGALFNLIQANPVGKSDKDKADYSEIVTALAKDIADKSVAVLFNIPADGAAE